jgi:hypothetical protein
MRALTSEADVRKLLDNRPKRTQTYQVAAGVLGRVPLDTRARLRTMTKGEVAELANYLDVPADELDGPFKVVRAECPHCGRQLTFVDFAKTGVTKRVHTKAQLRDILTGKAGSWITIRGEDGGRDVLCARCGRLARVRDGYSEYSSSSYAYA